MRAIFVGLPGSGKSTVGRDLAGRLELPFEDSDQLIEQQIGCSITDYFDREGEQAFRDIEESVIQKLTTNAGAGILATGGGAVLREVNRTRLRAAGHVIYLHASPEEIFRRVRRSSSRPLLQVADPLGRLHALYAERDPLYRATAHVVVETGRPSVAALVKTIMTQPELQGPPPPR